MKNILVVGSGTMGNGIAHVFAQAGFAVTLADTSQLALDKAIATIQTNLDRQIAKGTLTESEKKITLANLSTITDIAQAEPAQDLVIEAVSERMEVKKAIFSQLDEHMQPACILASNTSSISITALAAATHRADRVIGMHFMNPVPVMKLVEVIRGYSTSDETTAAVLQASERIGKMPVAANDYPGFVSNRILMPMINEAAQTLFEGVAGVQEIDQIMKLGMGHPMGPLHLADFIGLDICLNILNVMYAGFGQGKYAPCPLLVNMVAAGKLGAKSGEGFYLWADRKAANVSTQFINKKAGL